MTTETIIELSFHKSNII